MKLSSLLIASSLSIGAGLVITASAEEARETIEPLSAVPAAASAEPLTCDVEDGFAPASTGEGDLEDIGIDDELVELSDCDPKVVKRYCTYRSKCRADETRGAWMCKMASSRKFVARIPKRKSELVPECRSIRAKIRRMCEPRG